MQDFRIRKFANIFHCPHSYSEAQFLLSTAFDLGCHYDRVVIFTLHVWNTTAEFEGEDTETRASLLPQFQLVDLFGLLRTTDRRH